jgi:hypothetical protein
VDDVAFGLGGGLAAAAGLVGLGTRWSRLRGSNDPSVALREQAPRVARLFPAAFVVMGHTHIPEVRQEDGAVTTYVNLGAWAEEDADEGEVRVLLPATRTHLVVTDRDEGPVAELLTWDSGTGSPAPRVSGDAAFEGGFVAVDSPFTPRG